MAARALTAAAGRRMAGQTGPPLLASRRRGATVNHSTSAQPEEEHRDVDGCAAAAMTTGAQVEAALNRKNVEVLQGEEHIASTVLPDHETLGAGALEGAGEDASWMPDQETGVFVPADADSATHGGAPLAPPHPPGATAATGGASSSVLDQMMFVREEDMEDVERPAIDMAANANSKN